MTPYLGFLLLTVVRPAHAAPTHSARLSRVRCTADQGGASGQRRGSACQVLGWLGEGDHDGWSVAVSHDEDPRYNPTDKHLVKTFKSCHERGPIWGRIIRQHEVYLVIWVHLRSPCPGKAMQFTEHGAILKRSEFLGMPVPSVGSAVPCPSHRASDGPSKPRKATVLINVPDRIQRVGRLIAVALISFLASCGHPPSGSSSSSAPATAPVSASATAPLSSAPANEGGATKTATAPPSSALATEPFATQPATPTPTTTPSINPYQQFGQEVAGLVQRQATWQVPKHLEVNNTTRVGLAIGDTTVLQPEINALVPGSYPQPAGTVKVGPTIGVQLLANPDDASVAPSDAIDKSIGEHTALLWTWFVYPTHPNSSLKLTAEIVVNMPNGYVWDTELPLSIPLSRTWQYTAGQIFTSWLTWVSIVTVLAAAAGWIWRRGKRRRKPGASSPTPASPRKPSPGSRRSPVSRPARRGPRPASTSKGTGNRPTR